MGHNIVIAAAMLVSLAAALPELEDMVHIPAATFIMGTDDKDARDGEGPAKRVPAMSTSATDFGPGASQGLLHR